MRLQRPAQQGGCHVTKSSIDKGSPSELIYNSPPMPEENMLQLRRRIAAQPPTVYSFFLDSDRFTRWMGQGSSLSPNAGGEVRVAYPNGDIAAGKVVQLLPDKRVAFTWGYEGGAHGLQPGVSRVLIEFTESEGDTVVTLRHDGFPSDEVRRNHATGWRAAFALLANVAARQQYENAATLVDTYIRAWNQRDPVQRMSELTSCWAENGTYRDHLIYLEGREDFSEHIGATHAMAPSVRLEMVGMPQQCQGALRFLFCVRGDAGVIFATGMCVMLLAPEGRIRSVVSFFDGAV